jgi:hypothetical protein
MKLTRRQLALASFVSLAAESQTPAPPAVQSTPEDELSAAKAEVIKTVQVLSQFQIPMATEPSFVFEA